MYHHLVQNLYSSIKTRDNISHPYKTTCTYINLHILIFSKRCLNINLEDENRGMNENREFPNVI
jgi:hypothetical protein